VTTAAGGSLLRREDAAELGQNPGGSDGVEEEHFPEKAFGLSCPEARVGASIGKARLRKVFILRRHLQLFDSADLLADELAQLSWAVALSGGNSAKHGNEHEPGCSSAGYQILKEMAVNRRGRRSPYQPIYGLATMPFRFAVHVRVPPEIREQIRLNSVPMVAASRHTSEEAGRNRSGSDRGDRLVVLLVESMPSRHQKIPVLLAPMGDGDRVGTEEIRPIGSGTEHLAEDPGGDPVCRAPGGNGSDPLPHADVPIQWAADRLCRLSQSLRTLPVDKPLPATLVKRLVKVRIAENEQKNWR
jgi:hypothetical protein